MSTRGVPPPRDDAPPAATAAAAPLPPPVDGINRRVAELAAALPGADVDADKTACKALAMFLTRALEQQHTLDGTVGAATQRTLLAALRAHVTSTAVASWSCKALLNLHTRLPGQLPSCHDDVLAALCAHSAGINLQSRGLRLLAQIASHADADTRRDMVTAGALRTAVEALRLHGGNSELVKHGCSLLRHVCGSDVCADDGSFALVVGAMRSQAEQNVLCAWTCDALLALTRAHDTNAAAAVMADALQAVVPAMTVACAARCVAPAAAPVTTAAMLLPASVQLHCCAALLVHLFDAAVHIGVNDDDMADAIVDAVLAALAAAPADLELQEMLLVVLVPVANAHPRVLSAVAARAVPLLAAALAAATRGVRTGEETWPKLAAMSAQLIGFLVGVATDTRHERLLAAAAGDAGALAGMMDVLRLLPTCSARISAEHVHSHACTFLSVACAAAEMRHLAAATRTGLVRALMTEMRTHAAQAHSCAISLG
jgi:hypothetical protein